MSKCTQTQQVDAKKSKVFWEEVHALSASTTMTDNAFTRDNTVMQHVLAIVEASVHPSNRLSVCPSNSVIVSKQCRLDHETFTYKLRKRLLGIHKAFLKIRAGSFQPRELNKDGGDSRFSNRIIFNLAVRYKRFH